MASGLFGLCCVPFDQSESYGARSTARGPGLSAEQSGDGDHVHAVRRHEVTS